MHRCRTADSRCTHLGQAHVAHVASLDHVGDRTDRVFDRHVRVQPCGPVNVDVIDAQTLQRIREKVFHRRWTRIVKRPAARGIAHRAKFHADDGRVAPRRRRTFQRFADQNFVVTRAVEIPRIQQRNARFERGVDRGDAFGAIGRTVHARHAHTAQTQRRALRAGFTQMKLLHGNPR